MNIIAIDLGKFNSMVCFFDSVSNESRFRAETDQATRWLAYALTEVDKGYRRISGYADLPKLIAALKSTKTQPPKISMGLKEDNQTVHDA